MKVYKDYKNFKGIYPVITLGTFDGVHRGHRSLLEAVVSKALASGGESVAITLDPHPRIIISGSDACPGFLTSLQEKVKLIEQCGINHLIILPFSLELSKVPACDFVQNYLVDGIGIKHLVLGFDHQFGYQGHGNSETISDCAVRFGFDVERLGALRQDEGIISSTIIRKYLKEGALEKANELLGYNYSLKGTVVEGKQIGREIGYPTANINVAYAQKFIPKDGVYAVETLMGNKVYKAMLYIGFRPTLEEVTGLKSIEVNIFGFEGDIYGEQIEIKFRFRIRDGIKFSSTELLQKQIEKDKADTLRLLA